MTSAVQLVNAEQVKTPAINIRPGHNITISTNSMRPSMYAHRFVHLCSCCSCKTRIFSHQQDQQYSAARGFSRRASELAVCRRICCLPRINAEFPVFWLHLYLIQGFFGLLYNFTMCKTITSSRCKLWFCALVLRQSLTQDNLRAYCAVFNNSIGYNLFV